MSERPSAVDRGEPFVLERVPEVTGSEPVGRLCQTPWGAFFRRTAPGVSQKRPTIHPHREFRYTLSSGVSALHSSYRNSACASRASARFTGVSGRTREASAQSIEPSARRGGSSAHIGEPSAESGKPSVPTIGASGRERGPSARRSETSGRSRGPSCPARGSSARARGSSAPTREPSCLPKPLSKRDLRLSGFFCPSSRT